MHVTFTADSGIVVGVGVLSCIGSRFDCSPGGVVALSVECQTCNQEVVGSSLSRVRGVKTLKKLSHTYVPLSPSSTSWYRPKSDDALWLGSKGRYGLCVGVG